jgi:carboxyvinyl-carboxyphosphonate phosphorylmutase
VILGRTSSVRAEGLDRAVRRVKAYETAGVDGLFFAGQPSREDLEGLRSASSLPFVLGGTTSGLGDDAYLVSLGVHIGAWSHRPIQAATEAMYETLRALRGEASGDAQPPALEPREVTDTLSKKREYEQNTARYLR